MVVELGGLCVRRCGGVRNRCSFRKGRNCVTLVNLGNSNGDGLLRTVDLILSAVFRLRIGAPVNGF